MGAAVYVVWWASGRTRWHRKVVVPVSALRDTPGPIGACVEDVCLISTRPRRTSVVEAKDDPYQNRHTEGLARHGAAGLDENELVRAGCGFCSFAQERALVEDVDGFRAVTETNRDTWPVPVLPRALREQSPRPASYVEAPPGTH